MAVELPLTVNPSAEHTHTVVFLHGRGDNALKFADSLAFSPDSRSHTLAEALPTFRWVFPQAPLRRCAALPDTIRQWFDVWNVRNFAENEELQAEGLKEVVPAIRGILADEAVRLGGRWERIILAGISMGAATSLHVLFNLDVPRLGAFLGFSCRCPFAGRTLAGMRGVLGLEGVPAHDSVLRNTPMLLEHCVDDPTVLVDSGRRLREILRGFGAQVEWKEYADGGHWFKSPEGIDDAVAFLTKHLAGPDNAVAPSAAPKVPSGSMDLS